ncbi:hypothetical protein P0Y35_16715 [Kiritimatiellaeota bacterium B1221]|nr:hypothetical protein [Kiritimatiellaeota bacterium B1221]
MNKFLLLALLVPFQIVFPAEDTTPLSDSLKRFVYNVCMYDKRDSTRWLMRPRVTVYSENGGIKKSVETAVRVNLSKVLPGPEGDGILNIHIGDNDYLNKVGQEMYDKKIFDPDPIYYMFWSNRDYSLKKMLLFVSTESKVDRKKLLGLAAINGLGLFPYDDGKEESILSYENKDYQEMTPLDERLLVFLYKAIPPGSNRKEISDILDKQWDKRGNNLPEWIAEPEKFKGKIIGLDVVNTRRAVEADKVIPKEGYTAFIAEPAQYIVKAIAQKNDVRTLYVPQSKVSAFSNHYIARSSNGGEKGAPDLYSFVPPKMIEGLLWQLEDQWVLVIP